MKARANKPLPIHPGEILREEFMLPRGLSQNALARALHVPPRRINEIVLEKCGITADTALRLARFFGTSAEMWVGLQADYDLRLARHEKAGIIERDVEPLAALQLGIPFPKYVSRSELLQRLKQEILSLSDDDLAWWEGHKAKPFPVIHGDKSHFVVAVAGHDVLFFADDEDEFGVARLVAGSHTMTDYGLVGDLKDAIWEIRQNRLLN